VYSSRVSVELGRSTTEIHSPSINDLPTHHQYHHVHHADDDDDDDDQRRRFPPGFWVRTRPLLRPIGSIP